MLRSLREGIDTKVGAVSQNCILNSNVGLREYSNHAGLMTVHLNIKYNDLNKVMSIIDSL